MEGPGPDDPFEYRGWTISYGNQEIGRNRFEELFACDAFLLGRMTYQGFAVASPSRTDEAGFSGRMNSRPKYVVSNILKKAEWNNSTIISESFAGEVSKLKQMSGRDILVAGSATLVYILLEHNLVDEFRFLTYPFV
jgi:dihydrofolate reductase